MLDYVILMFFFFLVNLVLLFKISSKAKARVFLFVVSNSSHQKYMWYDSAQLAGTRQEGWEREI